MSRYIDDALARCRLPIAVSYLGLVGGWAIAAHRPMPDDLSGVFYSSRRDTAVADYARLVAELVPHAGEG